MGHRTKSLWEGKSHAFWGHLSLVLFLYITLRQICQFPSRNRNPSSQQWGQIQTEKAPSPEASHAQVGTSDQALAAELEKTEPEIPGLGQSLTSM